MSNAIDIRTKHKQHMIEWWLGTVIFAFFPSFILIVFSFLENGSVNILDFFIKGDMVLIAFSITFPAVIKTHKTNLILFILLLLICCVEACVYGAMCFIEKPTLWANLSVTIVLLLLSIQLSYIGEKQSERGLFERV